MLPDQNGWSRYLHFQAAWVLVLTGALYVVWGASSGHFRKHLLPDASDRSLQAFAARLARAPPVRAAGRRGRVVVQPRAAAHLPRW